VRAFFAYSEHPNFPARYNVAPTQPVPVVRIGRDGRPSFALMRWGFVPAYARDLKSAPVLINARSETAPDRPPFRNAFRRRRCLLPADGFYEWIGTRGAKRPLLMRRPGGALFGFAGIWECWIDRVSGGEIDTVAILTCAANRRLSAVHGRMPVVLRPAQFAPWLDCDESDPAKLAAAREMANAVPDDFFEMIELDPCINDSRRDEPGIQRPLQPSLL